VKNQQDHCCSGWYDGILAHGRESGLYYSLYQRDSGIEEEADMVG